MFQNRKMMLLNRKSGHFLWKLLIHFVPGHPGTEGFVPGHLLMPLSQDKVIQWHESIFAKNSASHHDKKNNTWNIRRLVDDSFGPSSKQTGVIYCRLTDFNIICWVAGLLGRWDHKWLFYSSKVLLIDQVSDVPSMYTWSPRNVHFGSWKTLCYAKTMLVEIPFMYIVYILYIYTKGQFLYLVYLS